MSSEDKEDRNRLQVFLAVERDGNEYVETDLQGKRTRYAKQLRAETIGIKNLNAFKSIDHYIWLSKALFDGRFRTGVQGDWIREGFPDLPGGIEL